MNGLINALEESVLVISTDGRVILSNESFLNNTGYTSSELKDSNVEKYLIYNDSSQTTLHNIKNNIGKTIQLNIVTKDKGNIKVNSKVGLDVFNNKECIFIICKNISKELYTKRDLEYVLDKAPFMVAIKDVNGGYVYVNDSVKRTMNITDNSYVGKNENDAFKIKYDKRVTDEDLYIIDNKKPRYDGKNVIMHNGVTQLFESYKAPILDENGEVTHIVKIAKDVSLEKKLEVELDKSYKELVNINSIVGVNIKNQHKYERLRDIQSYIVNAVHADGANIWIYDEKKENLISMFRCGISSEITGEKKIIKAPYTLLNKTLAEENHEGFKHIDSRARWYNIDSLKAHGIQYTCLYRISFNDELLGVLSIVFKDLNTTIQSKEEFMKTICNQMGMIIKNTNLSLEVKKELKRRLEVEKELELFLETATDLIAVIDVNGNIKKVNKECEELLGYSKDELLIMTWQDIVHIDDIGITNELIESSKSNSNKPIRGITRYKRKNGEILWLQWGAKFLKDKSVYICTARDITEHKKLSEQKKLYEASIQLEKIRNEFFANVSHEFKTPLNIILTTMQLINRGIEEGNVQITGQLDIKRYMKSIKQNSYRLLRLVNNLIDITRIDTGYYKLNLENVNIINIIEDITMSVAQYVEDEGITLVFDTEVEEEIVACDPDKIERIMLNLLSNAVKYTKINGEINVDIKVSSNNVIVSVKDNGIGIPKEKLKGIFQRFVRVDNLMTRQCEGSGIGLSLVKSLVEMHDGVIEVNSEVEKGTEFIFSIPIKTVDNEVKVSDITVNSRIEKCIIEFSDIYR